LLACLIVAPQRGYDEPGILSYAISSFCPTSADGLHPSASGAAPITSMLVSGECKPRSRCQAWATRAWLGSIRSLSLRASMCFRQRSDCKIPFTVAFLQIRRMVFMRRTTLTIAILALVWIGYITWPIYDLLVLIRAVETRDIGAVTRHVYFDAVRISLTNQIIDAYTRRTGVQ